MPVTVYLRSHPARYTFYVDCCVTHATPRLLPARRSLLRSFCYSGRCSHTTFCTVRTFPTYVSGAFLGFPTTRFTHTSLPLPDPTYTLPHYWAFTTIPTLPPTCLPHRYRSLIYDSTRLRRCYTHLTPGYTFTFTFGLGTLVFPLIVHDLLRLEPLRVRFRYTFAFPFFSLIHSICSCPHCYGVTLRDLPITFTVPHTLFMPRSLFTDAIYVTVPFSLR